MLPIQQFSGGVLAELIRRQPASKERTTFAWQIAVGSALARTTTVDIVGDVLQVTARDANWAREIDRAASTILQRMQHLLGPGAVTTLKVNVAG